MIVFLGEKKMHCGTKRKKKMNGGRMAYGKGKRVSYEKGGKAMKDAMRPCMPN
jgi:hypothetical protein